MYNLKKLGGFKKGKIGEALFVNLSKYVHSPKFDSMDWLAKMKFPVPKSYFDFLKENWGTIDAFEFIVERDVVKNIIFYEIKTRNDTSGNFSDHFKKPCMTAHAAQFYENCIKKGYLVKSVFVILFDNWDFSIEQKAYNVNFYSIWDGNPKYTYSR